jgi:O-antigen/teichoic acid export membrane protein
MHNRSEIIKNIVYYSSSAYVSQFIGLISVFFVARFLGPEDFGIWNAVMLVLSYAAYAEMGVLSVMGRDLPLYLGQRDFKRAAVVEGAARYTTIFGSVIVAVIIIFVSLFNNFSSKMSMGLQAIAFVLVFQQIYTYHRVYLRSHNRFKELSRQQVFFSLITAITSILFVIYGGLEGRFFAAIIANAFILFYAIRRNPWETLPKFNLSVAWSLMRVGIPIVISGFLITMLTTIDRIMIFTFLGESQLGYFGLGIMIVSIVSTIPAMAIQVLVPQINFIYGSTGRNIESLRAYVLNPSVVLSVLLPVFIGPIILLIPSIVQSYLPEYVSGIKAARIVTLGTFFYGILGLTDTFLVTLGKLKQYAFFGLLVLIFNIVLDFIFIKIGLGIEGVAIGGTVITYFFYSTIVIGYALSYYEKDLKTVISFFFRLWVHFLYMVVSLFLIDYTVNYFFYSEFPIETYLIVCFKIVFYLLSYLPLIYLVFKKLNINPIKMASKRFLG